MKIITELAKITAIAPNAIKSNARITIIAKIMEKVNLIFSIKNPSTEIGNVTTEVKIKLQIYFDIMMIVSFVGVIKMASRVPIPRSSSIRL